MLQIILMSSSKAKQAVRAPVSMGKKQEKSFKAKEKNGNQVLCFYCEKQKANEQLKFVAIDPKNYPSRVERNFCDQKCKNNFLSTTGTLCLVENLDSILQRGTKLTSKNYQSLSVSSELSLFYNHILCIFHSKVFQQAFMSVPLLREILTASKSKHIKDEQTAERNKDDLEYLYSDMQTIVGNLLECVKGKGNPSLNPAIETFAFIHNLLVRSEQLAAKYPITCTDEEEPELFPQYYPEAKDLPVTERVLAFLAYMYARIVEEDPQTEDQNPDNLSEKESPNPTQKGDLQESDQPNDDYSYESGDSEYDDSPFLTETFFEEIATNSKTIDLSGFVPQEVLPATTQDTSSLYLYKLKIADQTKELQGFKLLLSLQKHQLEIPLLAGHPLLKVASVRRLRCHLDEMISYPYKVLDEADSSGLRFLKENEDLNPGKNGNERNLRVVKIISPEKETSKLSNEEILALSHMPVSSLALIQVQYSIKVEEKDVRYLEHAFFAVPAAHLNSLVPKKLTDRNAQLALLQKLKTESPVGAILQELDGEIMHKLKEAKLKEAKLKEAKLKEAKLEFEIHLQQVQIEESQAFGTCRRLVIQQCLLHKNAPKNREPMEARQVRAEGKVQSKDKDDIPDIANVRGAIFEKLSSIPKMQVNFNYELEEILEALIGTQELEKLQQDVVEKKGPPTVLMIQFEKGMQLPMLGYYFLRAFSAGENLFSHRLPPTHQLGLSSFTLTRQSAKPEVFLNVGEHRQLFPLQATTNKLHLFSSIQAEMKNVAATCIEPEWITQIIYELQEKPKTAAP